MAVGFKSGGTDLDDIFLRTSEMTGASILSKVKSAGGIANANKLDGQTRTHYRCSGCSWTCSSGCTGGCRGGCTGNCVGGCTSCTGCSAACRNNCTNGCRGCSGCSGCTSCQGH